MKKALQLEVDRIHAESGYDYKMPDLANPLFILTRAIHDENGNLLGAAGLRLQAEAYLWLDPHLSVATRIKIMLQLHRELAASAWKTGIDVVVAYLPPNLPRSFRRLLEKLGWSRDREGWEGWSRSVE